jgi:hypothetical protein
MDLFPRKMYNCACTHIQNWERISQGSQMAEEARGRWCFSQTCRRREREVLEPSLVRVMHFKGSHSWKFNKINTKYSF